MGYGKNRIARELGVDKRTVKKYWGMEETRYRQYMEQSQYREKGFDGLCESILQLYRENENMGIPVSVVYDYFEETTGTLPANENSLRNYIKYLEKTGEPVITEKTSAGCAIFRKYCRCLSRSSSLVHAVSRINLMSLLTSVPSSILLLIQEIVRRPSSSINDSIIDSK